MTVIHPPRGYCIGILTGPAGAMIGPFATEDEAREALARAEIVIVGQPTGWQDWCGSTRDGMFCSKPRGHEDNDDDPDPWHDNGSVAWPAETPKD